MLKAYISDTSEKAAARRLLALAFSSQYGECMPPIEKTPSGKPYFPGRPDVHFSISHTKTHIMVCLGDTLCGCDIETVRPVNSAVHQKVCSDEELSHFDFFSCWVLKESFIKLNDAPTLDLKKTNFSLENGKIITPAVDAFARLYFGESFRAAIISKQEPPEELIFVPREKLQVLP